jgi:Asp-tRNA(Asn)/Glu-tRNA(Gln) amidotransferase A subunit family amidase
MLQIPESWQAQKRAIEGGKLRPIDLVDLYFKRIHARNPDIGALTDLLESAARSAAKAMHPAMASPVAGLCLVVKDMIDVSQAHCSGGLDYLRGRLPRDDAEVVARLRAAGALILAVSASDTGGFGVRSPEVRHPFSAQRIVGGSSGGSAAAVAAGFAPVALGTDSGGSIRIPAACCHVMGFKPSRGRISTKGVLPFSPAVDHVGCLARTIADIRLFMQVADPDFSASFHDRGSPPVIGIAPSYSSDAAPEIKAALQTASQTLAARGVVMRNIDLPLPSETAHIHDSIVATEAAALHPIFKARPPEGLPPVVRNTLAHADKVSQNVYKAACEKQGVLSGRVQEAFKAVDLVMVPTLPTLTPKTADRRIRIGEDSLPIDDSLRRYTFLFNLSGHPVISMPFQTTRKKITASLQLVGPMNHDAQLLSQAAILQDLLKSSLMTT